MSGGENLMDSAEVFEDEFEQLIDETFNNI